jgi:hypothetical protein
MAPGRCSLEPLTDLRPTWRAGECAGGSFSERVEGASGLEPRAKCPRHGILGRGGRHAPTYWGLMCPAVGDNAVTASSRMRVRQRSCHCARSEANLLPVGWRWLRHCAPRHDISGFILLEALRHSPMPLRAPCRRTAAGTSPQSQAGDRYPVQNPASFRFSETPVRHRRL